MIGYISVGTNNLESSSSFYDELFESMGAKRTYEFDDFVVWGKNESDLCSLCISRTMVRVRA